jgi:hypothetical protein
VLRRGDELYVKVGTSTRSLILPAALSRCAVRSARLEDGRLEVRFVAEQVAPERVSARHATRP